MNQQCDIQSLETLSGFDSEAAEQLLGAEYRDPFSVLGVHPLDGAWLVRALIPGATSARLVTGTGQSTAMLPYGAGGLFWLQLDDKPARYDIAAAKHGAKWTLRDPYQYGPVLSDDDELQLSRGTHPRLWEVLGARLTVHEGDAGAVFSVWAPNARRVSVVGDFNDWDGRRHAMRPRGVSGVWEIFVPGLEAGSRYKYEIAGADGGLPVTKADPMGRQMELRPGNCSVLAPPAITAKWHDAQWLAERSRRQRPDSPISIYEVHLGSWRRHSDGHWLSYRELAASLIPYVVDMGFTHLEILPITEHPLDGSWGYQPIGLYAPSSRYGGPSDFAAFVEACHIAGIGVILDWVPAHFPSDAHGLANFDGTALYEYENPLEGFQPQWQTLVYNLRRPQVANHLLGSATCWLEQFHIDSLRVDAVSSMLYRDYCRESGEWVPNLEGGRENLESVGFLQRLNTTLAQAMPDVMTVAEESTTWPNVTRPESEGGLGFGFKWNLGWMHDTLLYMRADPRARAEQHFRIGFAVDNAYAENFVLPLSHDEVVHGKGSLWQKMPGDSAAKLANLRAYYAFMWAHPGKKLLFMGQEFGQRSEWCEDGELEWQLAYEDGHAGLRLLVRDLNRLYKSLPALHQGDCRTQGFEWIDGAVAETGVFAWLRYGNADASPLLAVFNFSSMAHRGWRLGVPRAGRWRRVLATESEYYDGSAAPGDPLVSSEPLARHGQAQSLVVDLPALSGSWYVWENNDGG